MSSRQSSPSNTLETHSIPPEDNGIRTPRFLGRIFHASIQYERFCFIIDRTLHLLHTKFGDRRPSRVTFQLITCKTKIISHQKRSTKKSSKNHPRSAFVHHPVSTFQFGNSSSNLSRNFSSRDFITVTFIHVIHRSWSEQLRKLSYLHLV